MSASVIVPATIEHVHQMTGRLREADERECQASSGRSADEGLLFSYHSADKVWAFLKNGRAECMFGRCKPSWFSFWAAPWLLATKDFEKVGKATWRVSRYYVSEMMMGVDSLENYVDARNKLSIRWLRWCGFEIEKKTIPIGPQGTPFHRFKMRKNNV